MMIMQSIVSGTRRAEPTRSVIVKVGDIWPPLSSRNAISHVRSESPSIITCAVSTTSIIPIGGQLAGAYGGYQRSPGTAANQYKVSHIGSAVTSSYSQTMLSSHAVNCV